MTSSDEAVLPTWPKNASLRPRKSGPNSSCMVRTSASAWVGWNWAVRPFHTGTPALAAKSSTTDCSKPRYSMPSYMRPSTRAVSSMDSFLPICELPGSR